MDARKYIQGFYQISASIQAEEPLLQVIKNYEEKIPGGLANQKKPSDFDQSQLLKGIKVELEHTDNSNLALEIAMDHLTEMPDYYDHLAKMEKEAEKMHASTVVEATISKCSEKDAKPGRPWCVYKHDSPRDSQPKGWPKTYETEKDAKEAIKMMHVFGGNMKTTKAEVIMALASMGVEVVNDKIRRSDLKKILGNKEVKKSFEPPKKWFDKMKKEVQKGMENRSDEYIDSVIKEIWYKEYSDADRSEELEKDGKELGPTKEEE